MPSLFSIFISILSKIAGMGIDAHYQDPQVIEQKRLSINPPSLSDTTEVESIRHSYTMELLDNTKKAWRILDYENGIIYMVEAKRVSGYHGEVKTMYEKSLALYAEEVGKTQDCTLVKKKIDFVERETPTEISRFEASKSRCSENLIQTPLKTIPQEV